MSRHGRTYRQAVPGRLDSDRAAMGPTGPGRGRVGESAPCRPLHYSRVAHKIFPHFNRRVRFINPIIHEKRSTEVELRSESQRVNNPFAESLVAERCRDCRTQSRLTDLSDLRRRRCPSRGKSIVVIFSTIVLSLSSGAPVFAQISCKAVKFATELSRKNG